MTLRVVDDLGRVLEARAAPGRIVSLVPSVTELIAELGCSDRLVGVTRFCTDPPEVVDALPKLGGTKNPDCGAIVDLRPDAVVVNPEENRIEDFERLTHAGIAVFASHATTVEGAAQSVEKLGELLGQGERAGTLADDIRRARSESLCGGGRRRRVFCPIWRSPWMSFNAGTFSHDLLRCAGGENVCAGLSERYPEVRLDEIAGLDPEVVILPSEPYRFERKHLHLLDELTATTALRQNRVYLVDGKALIWYGRRTVAALGYFRELLHEGGEQAG